MIDKRRYLKKVVNFAKYNDEKALESLESALKTIYGDKYHVYLFKNGRSAQYTLLKAMKLPKGSKIYTQPFTCVSAIAPILWAGYTPEYVDIDRNTFSSVNKDYDKEILCVIKQFTFGISKGENKRPNTKYYVADCAHALGDSEAVKNVDAFFLSFGLEKTLSTKIGGALLVKDDALAVEVDRIYTDLDLMDKSDTFIWLLNPIFRNVIRKSGILGKSITNTLVSLGLFNVGFTKTEYNGDIKVFKPRKLPGVLASLVVEELGSLKENLKHRKSICRIYDQELSMSYDQPLVKYPVLVDRDSRVELVQRLKSLGFNITTWYDSVVYPKQTNLEWVKYEMGTCPVAQELVDEIINLPTGKNISEKDAKNISKIVKQYI